MFFFKLKIIHYRRILKQKCGSRPRMKRVNTHNKFQVSRTFSTEVIRLSSEWDWYEFISMYFFSKKLEKKNNFRWILKQKCGSRSRMRPVNTRDKFQTPRTLTTGVTSRIKVGLIRQKKRSYGLKKWSGIGHRTYHPVNGSRPIRLL